jgi:hypothetical protein
MLRSDHATPLTSFECLQLAEQMEETPGTAALIHGLLAGRCTAFVLGTITAWDALVIELSFLPGEPWLTARDADTAWRLLNRLSGWSCVTVEDKLAQPLGQAIKGVDGRPVRYMGDWGFELRQPVTPFADPAVRVLGLDDVEMLHATLDELTDADLALDPHSLRAGCVAGAVVDGQVVSMAVAESAFGRYAELGVHTLTEWRGRGFATAAASLVASNLQRAGRIPVWCTGEDNLTSQRVAQKLGFVECFRRTYVIRGE